MTSSGWVRVWHDEDGLGSRRLGGHPRRVLGALLSGPRRRHRFRAVEVWPSDRNPDRDSVMEVRGPTSAYGSALTLTFDGENERD